MELEVLMEERLWESASPRQEGLQAILSGRQLSKRYGAVVSLCEVDIDVYGGVVLGLIGDNGAGKSTLVQILVGAEQADQGQLVFLGETRRWRSPDAARAAGIETVFQDLGLCEELSVWRNFCLGREGRGGLENGTSRKVKRFRKIERREVRDDCMDALLEFGLHLSSPDVQVKALSGGERQALAIARAAHFGARMLVLDEPTSALSVRETERVLTTVRAAAERGMGCVVVSHAIGHIEEVADQVLVLQHGRGIMMTFRGELSRRELEDLVAGRSQAHAEKDV
jgi:simple sugar transport system ATP-binding protein